jgi:heme oxygenase (biliverdin-IX-beta and delta-forming)
MKESGAKKIGVNTKLSIDLLQPTTPQIVQQVISMITGARHAALGVIDKDSSFPGVSRVAMAALADGTPILLTSALAPHTGALQADGRCSLLIGELGKGDPMAHPRLTLFCNAQRLSADQNKNMRERFLAHHPKSINYIDLPDFGFWKLSVERISFNAGFGKAYKISGTELSSGG